MTTDPTYGLNRYTFSKPVYGIASGWVAHGFSRGGHESRQAFASPTAKAMGHPGHGFTEYLPK